MSGPRKLNWIDKAEEDWFTVGRLRQDIDHIPAILGYHCQQCVEKYLKAVIERLGTPPPRTHDPAQLFDQMVNAYPTLSPLRDDCELLAPYATQVRYPGEPPSVVDVEEAIAATTRVRDALRRALGIS